MLVEPFHMESAWTFKLKRKAESLFSTGITRSLEPRRKSNGCKIRAGRQFAELRQEKFPDELPSYLASMGLDCYEIECGRGVRIAAATYEKLPALASGNNITVTLHAPYFISLSSVEAENVTTA